MLKMVKEIYEKYHQATGEEHWKALEGCVGYLDMGGTSQLILRCPRTFVSISNCDSDSAKDENDRRSISGRINTLGGMITYWTSKKQWTASLSSSEAEHQVLSECVQETMVTQSLLNELIWKKTTSIIYEDGLGAIYLVKNMQISDKILRFSPNFSLNLDVMV
jgi:hypothetical protein